MSFDGRAASSSGCAIRPRGHETGSTGYIGRTPRSSPTGLYVMATAEHREPCESRGSCTVLGAPGGETPPGDSTFASSPRFLPRVRSSLHCRRDVAAHRERREACWSAPNSPRVTTVLEKLLDEDAVSTSMRPGNFSGRAARRLLDFDTLRNAMDRAVFMACYFQCGQGSVLFRTV